MCKVTPGRAKPRLRKRTLLSLSSQLLHRVLGYPMLEITLSELEVWCPPPIRIQEVDTHSKDVACTCKGGNQRIMVLGRRPSKTEADPGSIGAKSKTQAISRGNKKEDRAIVICSTKRFRAIAPSEHCSDSNPSRTPSVSSGAPSPDDTIRTPWTLKGASSPLPTDHQLIVKPNRSAFIAFAEIGHRMGISWVCVGLVRSWRQPPDLPENLQPTPLQLTVPHPVWIDRLPFPRMRDNVILLADNIDMAQFYEDLTLNESFEVKEDLPPHDPAAYRMVPQFKERWGYLFH